MKVAVPNSFRISSCQEGRHHLASYICKPKIAPLKAVSQFGMIEPEKVEHGGVQIVYMHRILGDTKTELVGGSEYLAPFDASSGHPNAERVRMMVPPGDSREAGAVFSERRPPEFGAPNNQCRIQKAALLQVLQQSADRLIGDATVKQQV